MASSYGKRHDLVRYRGAGARSGLALRGARAHVVAVSAERLAQGVPVTAYRLVAVVRATHSGREPALVVLDSGHGRRLWRLGFTMRPWFCDATGTPIKIGEWAWRIVQHKNLDELAIRLRGDLFPEVAITPRKKDS
jgi:hypothetical protein